MIIRPYKPAVTHDKRAGIIRATAWHCRGEKSFARTLYRPSSFHLHIPKTTPPGQVFSVVPSTLGSIPRLVARGLLLIWNELCQEGLFETLTSPVVFKNIRRKGTVHGPGFGTLYKKGGKRNISRQITIEPLP